MSQPGERLNAKRTRKMSRKALQNAVERKRHEVVILNKRLLKVVQAAESLDDSSNDSVLRELTIASEELKGAMQELLGLYEQDELNVLGDEALLSNEMYTLKHAYIILERLKGRKSDKLLETSSRHSRHSMASPRNPLHVRPQQVALG